MERRRFLQLGVGAVLVTPFLAGCDLDYGALNPADTNGLMLPDGFTSRIVATTGQQVGTTGYIWHPNPDGGACFDAGDGGWIYVSNDETYANGGVSMVRFDGAGNITDAKSICSGTSRNCAGGPMPWGTWLSGEEVADGQMWECDPFGVSAAVARPGMGRFNHEAAAADPVGKAVYLTEDRSDGGLYRFLPETWGDLSSGTLQVMTETSGVLGWAVVPDPSASSTETRDQVPTMRTFNGGEGIWYHRNAVYFTTKYDGRVWIYTPGKNHLSIGYDQSSSPAPRDLTGVDNLTVTGLVNVYVAEDGGNMEIVAVNTLDGSSYVFCRLMGREGSEMTGPAFSPDGTRFYFSSQRSPGETFEVTGPFAQLS